MSDASEPFTGKNLVVCSDGTGNRAGKGRGTNVWRLYEALARDLEGTGPVQWAVHDDGVGSSDVKLLAAIGGAFGHGLAGNVRELYAWLSRAYRPGDRLFLFGFSRGAFTVRCLAGMIARCGLIEFGSVTEERVLAAWRAYKWTQAGVRPKDEPAAEFKRRFGARKSPESDEHDVPIHFVGVWDTVAAYGLPIDELTEAVSLATQVLGPYAWTRFQDRRLHPLVLHGYHALALDDARHTFHPLLWDEEQLAPGQVVEQVWFSGSHSDVGGGYERGSLALVSLDWMMSRAEEHGLRFDPDKRREVNTRKNALGPLHDSRSGLAVFYRYRPRDVPALCAAHHVRSPRVHASVLERIELTTGDHAPEVLPAGFDVVARSEGGSSGDAVRALPARTARRPAPRFLERLRGVHWWRRVTYYALIAWTVALALVVLRLHERASDAPAPGWFGAGRVLALCERFLPSFLGDAVGTLRREPFWALLFVGVLVFFLRLRALFVRSEADLARVAWFPELLHAPDMPRSGLQRRLLGFGAAMSSSFSGLATHWRKRIVPVAVLVLAFAGLVKLAERQVRAGWILGEGLFAENVAPWVPALELGRPESFEFTTDDPGRPREWLLLAGERYSVDVEVTEPWFDDGDGPPRSGGPTGLVEPTVADGLTVFLRRDVRRPPFALLATIGPAGRTHYVGHGTTLGPLAASGRLRLFVNDRTSYLSPAGPWTDYAENRGRARITLTRLGP